MLPRRVATCLACGVVERGDDVGRLVAGPETGVEEPAFGQARGAPDRGLFEGADPDRDRALHRQGIEAHVVEEAQARADLLHHLGGDLGLRALQVQAFEVAEGLGQGAVADLVDGARVAGVGIEQLDVACLAAQTGAMAIGAGLGLLVAAQLFAHGGGIGLLEAALEVGNDPFENMRALDLALLAARAIGLARGALEDATAYAQERRQFGQAIGDFQNTRFRLARMATEIEASRQLMYFVCDEIDQKRRCDKEAAMAKLHASEMAERVTSEALQVFGGAGYTTLHAVERYWRDARLTKIFEGTSEIQQRIISDHLLGKQKA